MGARCCREVAHPRRGHRDGGERRHDRARANRAPFRACGPSADAETDDGQTDPDAAEGLQEVDDETAEAPAGPGPAAPAKGVMVTGYVDVGFAKAQGNGTSYPPGDNFASPPTTASTRSRPPSTRAATSRPPTPSGRFVNGFLPRSVGIGGHPSFLLNTLNADLRYTAAARRCWRSSRAAVSCPACAAW